MRYVLPMQHVLYFGSQVNKKEARRRGRVPRGCRQHRGSAEPDVNDDWVRGVRSGGNRKVLVDHVFIVAGGEITKAARNWLGGKLDATQRSQVMFMERDDILRLFVMSNAPLPPGALPAVDSDDVIPF
jgi:hypothetical protein